jgi:hypothetical protein
MMGDRVLVWLHPPNGTHRKVGKGVQYYVSVPYFCFSRGRDSRQNRDLNGPVAAPAPALRANENARKIPWHPFLCNAHFNNLTLPSSCLVEGVEKHEHENIHASGFLAVQLYCSKPTLAAPEPFQSRSLNYCSDPTHYIFPSNPQAHP